MAQIIPILLASGSSSRFGKDKLIQAFGESQEPLFMHAVKAFHGVLASEVLLVCPEAKQSQFAPFLGDIPCRFVPGGAERYLSVKNALEDLLGRSSVEEDIWVAIHDCARPLITEALISKACDLAIVSGGAIVASPVTDTIKHRHPDGRITSPDRGALYKAETPQIFALKVLYKAICDLIEQGKAMTDDASAMEAAGHAYALCVHEGDNRKITFQHDL